MSAAATDPVALVRGTTVQPMSESAKQTGPGAARAISPVAWAASLAEAAAVAEAAAAAAVWEVWDVGFPLDHVA